MPISWSVGRETTPTASWQDLSLLQYYTTADTWVSSFICACAISDDEHKLLLVMILEEIGIKEGLTTEEHRRIEGKRNCI
jgi:uncharacterized membrane protein